MKEHPSQSSGFFVVHKQLHLLSVYHLSTFFTLTFMITIYFLLRDISFEFHFQDLYNICTSFLHLQQFSGYFKRIIIMYKYMNT